MTDQGVTPAQLKQLNAIGVESVVTVRRKCRTLIAREVNDLLERLEHEDRLTDLARTAEIKRAVAIFAAACSEFNRVHDNLKGSLSDHAAVMQQAVELREQEFDTLYESAQARHAISVELAKLHRSFLGISEAWDKTYERVIAAVVKLDNYDSEELRAADSRIAAVPRYAAA